MHRVKSRFVLYYLIFVSATHNLVSMLQVDDAVLKPCESNQKLK